jgi:DNA-binding NarL/FixJ family response regulator
MNERCQNASCGGTLSVLLADDHAKVLGAATLALRDRFHVVATVTDGLKAIAACKRLRPDIIVLDIVMPEMDGIETARALRESGCTASIIFLTVLKDEAYIAAARCYGNGYVLKARLYSDLVPAIEEALAGKFFISPCHQS